MYILSFFPYRNPISNINILRQSEQHFGGMWEHKKAESYEYFLFHSKTLTKLV